MIKLLLQGITIAGLFLLSWFGLSQVDWMRIFHTRKATEKTEQKIGDMFWDMLRKNEKEEKDSTLVQGIDSIVKRICIANNLDTNDVKPHILVSDEVNAFALPDGHLVVYTALIADVKNEAELAGVIGHEIAHIELRHVMKKLVKEVGISALVSMTSGGKSGAARQLLKKISSSAFDRQMEKDADLKSVDYTLKAGISPTALADFLYRFSEAESDADKYLSWINTHPYSKERADYIITYSKGRSYQPKQILSEASWQKMKEKTAE